MTNQSSRRSIALLVFAATWCAGAEVVDLAGTVKDAQGKPLSGIVVSLDDFGLADTTKTDGSWQFLSRSTGIVAPRTDPQVRWNGKRISLSLGSAAVVDLDAFDARGVRLAGFSDLRMQPGDHDLSALAVGSAKGAKWIRLSIDGKSRIMTTGFGSRQAAKAAARSMNESIPPLVYSYQGREICSKRLDSLNQKAIEQTMREFRVRAKAIPDTGARMDSMLVHLEGGDSTGMRKAGLRFDPQDSICSGRLFAPWGRGVRSQAKRAWIDVLGNGGRRIGISDTAGFPSDADTLRFDSAFGMANALPTGTITGDSVRVVNTSYELGLALNRRNPGIRVFEWDAGDGKGFQIGSAVKSMKWLEGLRTRVCSRLTDVDGNKAEFCKPITVIARDSMGGPENRTVVAGKGMVFSVNVFDKDGVLETIFDFGDGFRDTVHDAPYAHSYHEYAVMPPVAGQSSRICTLTVTMIDGRGDATIRTAIVTVVNPRNSIVVMNTVGETGQPLALQARLLDTATISAVEWSVAGSAFRPGRADTTIVLPNAATEAYPVLVRASDAQGRQYLSDTVRVRALVADRVVDARDGRSYRVVTIGTQTWMAQNLDYRQTTGSKDTVGICYDNDADTCAKYGRLYTWSQAMGLDPTYDSKSWPGATAKPRGICPKGWHVPLNPEWQKLIASAGGEQVGGGRLKSTYGWNDDCKCGTGTDNFWFSALPGGMRHQPSGEFMERWNGTYWWTATQEMSTKYGMYATDIRTFYMDPSITFSSSEKGGYESVRCLKD